MDIKLFLGQAIFTVKISVQNEVFLSRGKIKYNKKQKQKKRIKY